MFVAYSESQRVPDVRLGFSVREVNYGAFASVDSSSA